MKRTEETTQTWRGMTEIKGSQPDSSPGCCSYTACAVHTSQLPGHPVKMDLDLYCLMSLKSFPFTICITQTTRLITRRGKHTHTQIMYRCTCTFWWNAKEQLCHKVYFYKVIIFQYLLKQLVKGDNSTMFTLFIIEVIVGGVLLEWGVLLFWPPDLHKHLTCCKRCICLGSHY